VPLFILVLPVTNSGPTTTSTAWSAAAETGAFALQEMEPVRILFARQAVNPPIT